MNIVPQQFASQTEIETVAGVSFEQFASNEDAALQAVLKHTQLLLQTAITLGMPQPLCDELAAEIEQLGHWANFV